MDWQALINQFSPLTRDDVKLFAPPRDMEQALGTYNRAIHNLNHDSADIALIALRKLAATWPMFAEAALLLSYCQAQLGQFDEALEQLDHALLTDLPEALLGQALVSREQMTAQRFSQNQQSPVAANGSEYAGQDPRKISGSTVLEKTGRRGRVRMANAKERQDVIRRGEFPEEEETNVAMRREPVEYLRMGIPIIVGILLLVILIFAGIRFLPGLFGSNSQDSQEQVRLAWLTGRLDALAGKNDEVDQLMIDYRANFDPTPTPGPAATSGTDSTTAVTTASISPTSSQPAATTASQTIPSPTPTIASTLDAAAAAEQFRVLGMAEFDKQKYPAALEYFLKAYQLNPRAYGGGVAYYCGRCYQELNNKTSAKPYYEFVVKNFSGRDIAVRAAVRLKEMGF